MYIFFLYPYSELLKVELLVQKKWIFFQAFNAFCQTGTISHVHSVGVYIYSLLCHYWKIQLQKSEFDDKS